MIIDSVKKAFQQTGDPAFRRVFFLSVGIALALFALLLFLMIRYQPEAGTTEFAWLDEALSWLIGASIFPIFAIVAYFLFPPTITFITSLFLDPIIDAVEARYYPGRTAVRKSSLLEELWLALRLSLLVLAANIVVIPLYLVLLFTGIGPFILYLLLNAWLLGREYFELVAVRHTTPAAAERLRKEQRDQVFIAGVVIAGLFFIPVVNLAAPIIGTAVMVHLFHKTGMPEKARPLDTEGHPE